MYNKPKAIFFDFDGVILESADIKTQAFLELFNDYPSILPQIEDYHLQNVGISRFTKFEWIFHNLLGKKLSQTDREKLGEQFSKIVYQKVIEAPFVPGALRLLDLCKDTIPCFIASGTPEDELKKIVEERKILNYFKIVCGTPKTKIEIVESLLKDFSLQANECWFIGDAKTDLEAALATGCKFVARSTPPFVDFWRCQKDIWTVESMEEVADTVRV